MQELLGNKQQQQRKKRETICCRPFFRVLKRRILRRHPNWSPIRKTSPSSGHKYQRPHPSGIKVTSSSVSLRSPNEWMATLTIGVLFWKTLDLNQCPKIREKWCNNRTIRKNFWQDMTWIRLRSKSPKMLHLHTNSKKQKWTSSRKMKKSYARCKTKEHRKWRTLKNRELSY